MNKNRIIKTVVCCLLLLGGVWVSPTYAYMSYHNRTWGDNGYVHDYYYGERSHFQMDDNMFNYGSTATWDMYSTSTTAYTAATFSTAASNITAGSTLIDYQDQYVARVTGRRIGGGGEPPTEAPIGDGLWFLLLLAAGYGYVHYRRRQTNH